MIDATRPKVAIVSGMERALRLVEPYTHHAWVRGVYLVGSASRPFRDAVSDYDFEIAVDDVAYGRLTAAEKHIFAMDPEVPTRVDYEFYLRPWSELEALRTSTRDLDHYPFQHASILFDRDGDLAPLLAHIAELPAAVRAVRCRVHYLEVLAAKGRSAKCAERGERLNARLVAADGVAALARLLFLLHGSWPAMRHWTSHELRIAGVDRAVVERMTAALEGDVAPLLETAREQLDAHGFDFHHDIAAFRTWAFVSDEGKRALATWGAR
jgi:hypothetical protein